MDNANSKISNLSGKAIYQKIHHNISQVVEGQAIALKTLTRKIGISESIKHYVVNIVNATRSASGVKLGASPRASLALMKLAQALALFNDSEFVTPEHIQELAIPAIAHRLIIDPQARFSGMTAENIVGEIINTVPVPA